MFHFPDERKNIAQNTELRRGNYPNKNDNWRYVVDTQNTIKNNHFIKKSF